MSDDTPAPSTGDAARDPLLYNEDIAPTPPEQRTWSMWHIASLWVGMAVCIPTYMLASQMIINGLTWIEALAMIVLGNVIVAIPMVFNGHAGTKYGIPFPVLGRASFGWLGIQVPSLLRALVACGWFGIQTWLGGLAIVAIASVPMGAWLNDAWWAQFLGFIVFWFVNMFFVWRGTESIRILETLAAPILILVGAGMLVWGVGKAGGMGALLESSYEFRKPTVELTMSEAGGGEATFNLVKGQDGKPRATHLRGVIVPSQTSAASVEFTDVPFAALPERVELPELKKGEAYAVQFQSAALDSQGKPVTSSVLVAEVVAERMGDSPPAWELSWVKLKSYMLWLTAMVAFWATLALNIPDITRFARSQRDQAVGQFVGLPTTMALYSFIGVAVTCAAILSFDDILITADAPWDPIRLLTYFSDQPLLMIAAQLAILLATLSTNIAANVISPANSFANVLPKYISFKMGGTITGILGILIMPWWLIDFIVGFLLTYGAILGPVLGILIADYYVVRKTELAVDDLYRRDGAYPAINPVALVALVLGVAPVLIAYFAKGSFPALGLIYDTGWFVGFGVAAVVYAVPMLLLTRR